MVVVKSALGREEPITDHYRAESDDEAYLSPHDTQVVICIANKLN